MFSFGLCYLLGFSFMSRLKDQQLYRIERGSSHGVVDGLYRGTVDTPLIREQYDVCCLGWNVTVRPPWHAPGCQETGVEFQAFPPPPPLQAL